MIAAGKQFTVAVTTYLEPGSTPPGSGNGGLWVWGMGSFMAKSHPDYDVPVRIGGPSAFNGSPALTVACGNNHLVVATLDGSLWTIGSRLALGHGIEVGTRRDIAVPRLVRGLGCLFVAVAAFEDMSMAVTQDGHLYCWGTWTEDTTEPALGSTTLDPHGRIGRCQALPPQHALALAMGSHSRLGTMSSTTRSRRSGTAAAPPRDKSIAAQQLPSDVLSSIVRACRAKPLGPAGSYEGVMRLIGGGDMMPGVLALAQANPPVHSASRRTRSQVRASTLA
jgi:hypothetical protein